MGRVRIYFYRNFESFCLHGRWKISFGLTGHTICDLWRSEWMLWPRLALKRLSLHARLRTTLPRLNYFLSLSRLHRLIEFEFLNKVKKMVVFHLIFSKSESILLDLSQIFWVYISFLVFEKHQRIVKSFLFRYHQHNSLLRLFIELSTITHSFLCQNKGILF